MSIMELLRTVEQGGRVSTASPETSATSPSMPLVRGNDSSAGQWGVYHVDKCIPLYLDVSKLL